MDDNDPDDVDLGADVPFRSPPPPEDRLWRHPSELMWDAASPNRRPWVLALGSSLVGSVLTVGLLTLTGAFDTPNPPPEREVVIREAVREAPITIDPNNIVAVAADVRPAIVRLEIAGDRPGVGSGVVFRDDGAIVTSAHIVEGASRVTVELSDGRRLRGRIAGADKESDIAVVRVDGDTPFPTVVLGSVEGLEVGEAAIAIGSPLGLAGPASVTTGIISALGRQLAVGTGWQLRDLIQTDAIIAPGSSGGALLDGEGVVIGITTAYASDGQGQDSLGFAIPVDIARRVATDLLAGKPVRQAWLGIRGEDRQGGVRLAEVVSGGPTDYAGLAVGDVIISLDDHHVDSMSALRVVLRSHRPGERVPMRYMRKGKERGTAVTLGEHPAPEVAKG